MTEFKPGDVVSVSHPVYDDGPYRAIVRARRAAGDALEVALDNGGFDILSDAVEQGDVRPLVVIDPEEIPAAKGSLAPTWLRNLAAELQRDPATVSTSLENVLTYLADRIDETNAPPRPDEPTGLGAVVEDENGDRFVRVVSGPSNAYWHCTTSAEGDERWPDIAVSKVLSEGVTE
jgi:hypothetical protein